MPRCTRCAGQLFHSSDHYGRYLSCIQCGHVAEEATDADCSIAQVLWEGLPPFERLPGRRRKPYTRRAA